MLSIQGDDIIVAAEKDLLTTLFSVDLVETKLMTHPEEVNFSIKSVLLPGCLLQN